MPVVVQQIDEPSPSDSAILARREKGNRYAAAFRARNRAKLLAAAENYHQRNKNDPEYQARRKRTQQKWRAKNPEKVRAFTWRSTLKEYGLTQEDYDKLLAAQNHTCALCPRKHTNTSRLLFDHCHSTGVLRGLLCVSCNSGLGKLGDSIEGLKRGLAYLESPTAKMIFESPRIRRTGRAREQREQAGYHR